MRFKNYLILSVSVLILGMGMVGCSSSSGSDDDDGGAVVPSASSAVTSVSGLTGSSSTASSVGTLSALGDTEVQSEGLAKLVVDANGNGVYDDSVDIIYTAPILNGSFSFENVSVDADSAVVRSALLTVTKDGFAPYQKVLKLKKGNAVSVLAEISKPVLTEVIDISGLSESEKKISFVKFGTRVDGDSLVSFSKLMSLSDFAAQADENLSQKGTRSQSVIPTGALPSGVETVVATMQSFNSSDREDFSYFPGKLSGHGKPAVGTAATSDSDEVALESAGFDLIKLTDQNGDQIDLQPVSTSKLSALADTEVCGGMEWTRYLHSAEVAVIQSWGDDDGDASNGYQVPIWSNDNATGSWQYVALATVYDLNGSNPYFVACVDTKWQGYLNCDSPLATTRPQQICIGVTDQDGNPIGGMNVYGQKGGSYTYAYIDNYGDAKGKGFVEVRDSNITGWSYTYRSSLTGWSDVEVDPALIVKNTTNPDCDYDMNITIENPYTTQLHVKAYAIDDINYTTPLIGVNVKVLNEEYENYFSQYGSTDENGTVTFEVKPDVEYKVIYKAGEVVVKADGVVESPETSDTTREVFVNVKDENVAPKVYIYTHSYNVTDKTQEMIFSVSAQDKNNDSLTFVGLTLDGTPLVEGSDYTVEDRISYDGYYYINGKLNLQSATLSTLRAALAAKNDSYILSASFSDGKLNETSDNAFYVYENSAPTISSLYLRDNNTRRTYYSSSTNIPEGNFSISAYIYDRDGDDFNVTYVLDGSPIGSSVMVTKGDHNVSVTAIDENNNTATRTLRFYAGNHVPEITSYGSTDYFVNSNGTFQLYAYVRDSDGDSVTIKATAVNGQEYNLTRASYYGAYRSADINIADVVDVNGLASFSIVANDGEDDSTGVNVEVVLNQAPTVTLSTASTDLNTTTAILDLSTNVPIEFTCTSTDPEGTSLVYLWSVDNVSVYNRSPLYTKTFTSEGEYTVTCTVYDRDGENASDTLSVNLINTNTPPEIASTTYDASVNSDSSVSGTISFSDPDGEATIAVEGEVPRGFSIDPNTGAYTFDASVSYATLPIGENISVEIPLVVTDDAGATAYTFLYITVNGVYSDGGGTGDDTEVTVNNDSPFVGAWVTQDNRAILIFTDNGHYFYTGTMGLPGGVEAGVYILDSTKTTASMFSPAVNTNGGEGASGAVMNYDAANDTISVSDNLESSASTAIFERVPLGAIDTSSLEKGAWVSYDETTQHIITILMDGDRYMFTELDLLHNSNEPDAEGNRYNATEFGTYALDSDGNFVPTVDDPIVDFTTECTEADESNCYGLTGDANGNFGMNNLLNIVLTFTDDNHMNVSFFDGETTQTAVFVRIIQNGPDMYAVGESVVIEDDISTVLASRTVYSAIDNTMGTLESWEFNSDFTSVVVTELEGGSSAETLSIADYNTTSFTTGDGSVITVVGGTFDYALVSINGGESQRVYFDETAARAYFLGSTAPLAETVAGLMAPTATANVDDAKNLFAQLREVSDTFIDPEELNTSTIVGAQQSALEDNIQPKIDDIVEDLNVSVDALESCISSFTTDMENDFDYVMSNIENRLDALATVIDMYDENTSWTDSSTFGDTITHTYSKSGTTVTESYVVNDMNITTSWEDTEDGDFNSLTTNGVINLSGDGYDLNITSLSFDGTSADFNSTARIDGNNSAYMDLNELSMSFDVNIANQDSFNFFENVQATFSGEISTGERVIHGTVVLDYLDQTKNKVTGDLQCLAGEPTFSGEIALNMSLSALKSIAADSDNSTDIYKALLMVTFDDGTQSFVTKFTEQWSETQTDFLLVTQADRNITCRGEYLYTDTEETYQFSCEGGSVTPYYGYDKIITLTTASGDELSIEDSWWYSTWTENGVEYSLRFYSKTGSGFVDETGRLFYNGEEVVINSISMRDATTFEDYDFDISLNGTLSDGAKTIAGRFGIVNATSKYETRVYVQNLNIADGTNYAKADSLEFGMRSNDMITFLEEDGVNNEYWMYSTAKNSYVSYSNFETYTVVYSEEECFECQNDQSMQDYITAVNIQNLSLSVTDADGETLLADANFTYNKDADNNESVEFIGNYDYRATNFNGHITLDANKNEDRLSAYVKGEVSANGYEPFGIESIVSLNGRVTESYLLFSRGEPAYQLGASVVGDLDGVAVINIGDSNGVISTYTYVSSESDSGIVLTFTDKDGTSLATVGEDATGNNWEVQYADGSAETLY